MNVSYVEQPKENVTLMAFIKNVSNSSLFENLRFFISAAKPFCWLKMSSISRSALTEVITMKKQHINFSKEFMLNLTTLNCN